MLKFTATVKDLNKTYKRISGKRLEKFLKDYYGYNLEIYTHDYDCDYTLTVESDKVVFKTIHLNGRETTVCVHDFTTQQTVFFPCSTIHSEVAFIFVGYYMSKSKL